MRYSTMPKTIEIVAASTCGPNKLMTTMRLKRGSKPSYYYASKAELRSVRELLCGMHGRECKLAFSSSDYYVDVIFCDDDVGAAFAIDRQPIYEGL